MSLYATDARAASPGSVIVHDAAEEPHRITACERASRVGRASRNVLVNTGALALGATCRAGRDAGQYLCGSYHFVCTKEPESRTPEDERHVFLPQTELYATHYPFERQRAEFSARPTVRATREFVSDCKKSMGDFRRKRIDPRTQRFSIRHPRVSAVVKGTGHGVGAVAGGVKRGAKAVADEAFTRPMYSDIQQGSLGDCYFLASLASLARIDPKHIKKHLRRHLRPAQALHRAVHSDKHKYYDVALYLYDEKDGSYRKKWVTVDTCFRANGLGDPKFAKADDHDDDGLLEIWPALVEKAYIQEFGESAVGRGGTGLEAFRALTGKRPHLQDVDRMTDTELRCMLAASTSVPMVAGTHGRSDSHAGDDHVVERHMYSVLEMGHDAEHGDYVLVRNPWGKFEPGSDGPVDVSGGAASGDGVDDGVFRYSLRDFKRKFMYVTCADVDAYNKALSVARELEDSPSLLQIKMRLKRNNVRDRVDACRARMHSARASLSRLTEDRPAA